MLDTQKWTDLIAHLYDHYGYLVVFLGALGENTAVLGFVMPGNTIALLGAVYARLGTLNLVWVIFFAWLGTILGYHADYLFGHYILIHVAQRWSASRLGRRLRLAGRLRLARVLLSKHGGKAILLSHTFGHLRSFVALSAGMIRMSYRRFLFFEVNFCFRPRYWLVRWPQAVPYSVPVAHLPRIWCRLSFFFRQIERESQTDGNGLLFHSGRGMLLSGTASFRPLFDPEEPIPRCGTVFHLDQVKRKGSLVSYAYPHHW